MGRAPCCDKANVKKGPWSPEEDTKLKEYIEKYGTGGNWIALPYKAGLRRCGKSCRLRWLNYLRPNLKHGQFSEDEDRVICSLYASIGSRWSIIAAQLPGRTDNDIKNYWNTKLKKKFMGIVPSSPHTKPLPPPIYPSPFHNASTYEHNINYYPFPIPSNFLSNTSLLRPQENLVGFVHHYQEKDNLVMFGTGEPSCCSSSDIEYEYSGNSGADANGAQIGQETTYFYNGVLGNEKTMLGGGSGWGETPLPLPLPLEFDVEDIKQLVSTNGCSSNMNMLMTNNDHHETKTQGRVMYL